MKTFPILLVLFLSIGFHSPSSAGSSKSSRSGRAGYVQKDPLFHNSWNLYDRNGRRKGYLEEDQLFKDRVNINKY
jgi:hypothetical protein